MKKIIKSILRMFGLIIMKRASRVYLPDDETYRIAIAECGEKAPIIFDGGAHTGGTVDAFRLLAPLAEFHCFEPDPALTELLSEKFQRDSQIHIVSKALGKEPGVAEFNINASRPTNSLLPSASGLQEDLRGFFQTVKKVQVPVTTVDEYFLTQKISRIDILKLDLQGYDYFALQGASTVLGQVRVVLVEVLFTELYKGCQLFPDILHLMNERGFRLFTLSGIHYGESDELLWADAIFVKSPAPVLLH
jgi:FkbM family methyltransferase